MVLRWLYSALSCAIFAAGCTTLPSIPASVVAGPESALTRLSPITLGAGECGLFVWTASAQKRFVLFSQSQEGTGVWVSESGEENLTIDQQEGTSAHSQRPKIEFRTPRQERLELDLRQSQAITDGMRYKSGTLTLTSLEGWEKVTPVVGLSACQAL